MVRMRWVVFLRAVNVGGANLCRPAQIAKQLAKFDIVNIGAVGTFVVRDCRLVGAKSGGEYVPRAKSPLAAPCGALPPT